jgi:hypothetical protein
MSELIEEVIREAEQMDTLPSSRREACFTAIWNGVIISFLVFFLEYVVWSPIWNRIVVPLWNGMR